VNKTEDTGLANNTESIVDAYGATNLGDIVGIYAIAQGDETIPYVLRQAGDRFIERVLPWIGGSPVLWQQNHP
jgi:hypothetical protein